MNTFAVVFLFIQACLFQNVFGQCFGAYGPASAITPGFTAPYGFGYDGLAYPGLGDAYPTSYSGGLAPYGGVGEGNVAVAGELPVAGTTAVAGQVPIMGAVSFGGAIPAAGAVSIAGQCACGCVPPTITSTRYT